MTETETRRVRKSQVVGIMVNSLGTKRVGAPEAEVLNLAEWRRFGPGQGQET